LYLVSLAPLFPLSRRQEHEMTDVVDPPRDRPPYDERRPQPADGVFSRFDLLDRVGVGVAEFAEVALPDRPVTAPRINAGLLRQAGTAIVRDPEKRRIFMAYAGAVLLFSAVVATLLVTGMLGAAYEWIWRRVPGRPWTHVMRDHPWVYGLLAVGLSVVPFLLAPRGRWGRAFLTYVIFLIGFLGGHVFW
jgi:hypothetical protein